jgi:hypothetical protein
MYTQVLYKVQTRARNMYIREEWKYREILPTNKGNAGRSALEQTKAFGLTDNWRSQRRRCYGHARVASTPGPPHSVRFVNAAAGISRQLGWMQVHCVVLGSMVLALSIARQAGWRSNEAEGAGRVRECV